MLNQVSSIDYAVFALSLMVPILIALYYAFVRKQETTAQYMMGDRKVAALPMSVSLAVSYLSAVTITGVPGEIAYHGFLFPWTWLLSASAALLVVGNLLIPIFYKMKLTSVYEYLELRYNSRAVRLLVSTSYVVTVVLYMGVVLYAPCLAIKTMTGLPVLGVIVLGGVIGTFYTVLGGLKAVVWTDTFQALVMIGGLAAIVAQGTVRAGGPEEVWRVGVASGRVEWADWDPSPFARTTTWSVFFGQFVIWGAMFGCHQTQVQRYCATRSLAQARWSLFLSAVMMVLIVGPAIVAGLVVFANYWSCDPKTEGVIEKKDELVTLFVLQHLSQFHGIPGMFTASLLSGALSSLSSGLNSLSAVIWEDFLRHFRFFYRMSDSRQVQTSRAVAATMGVTAVGVAYAASNLDGVLQLASTAIGIGSGPMLAVFLLGFFTSTANKFGAVCGVLCGNAVTVWLFVGSVFLRGRELSLNRQGSPSFGTLGTWTVGCDADHGESDSVVLGASVLEDLVANNNSTQAGGEGNDEDFFYIPEGDWQTILYSTSYHLYGIIGFLVCFLVTIFVSLVTRLCHTPKPVDQMLLHQLVRYRGPHQAGGGMHNGGIPPFMFHHAAEYRGGTAGSAARYPHPGGSGLVIMGGPMAAKAENPWQMTAATVTEDIMMHHSHFDDTHYRWPSPSLPPTLKKNKMKIKTQAAVTAAAAEDELTNNSGTGQKTISRQSVIIAACQQHKSPSPTPSSSSSSSSSSASSSTSAASKDEGEATSSQSESTSIPSENDETTTANLDEDEDNDGDAVELDEFGDVIPPHLRKNKKGKQKKKSKKKQMYKVQKVMNNNNLGAGGITTSSSCSSSTSGGECSTNGSSKSNRNAGKGAALKPVEEEDGWGTDF